MADADEVVEVWLTDRVEIDEADEIKGLDALVDGIETKLLLLFRLPMECIDCGGGESSRMELCFDGEE